MPSSQDLSHHFPSLSSEAGRLGLEAIYVKARARELTAGTHLIEAGQAADSVYFLVSGRLDVILPLGEMKVDVVGTFGAGSVLGEVAVLDPAPASTTVIAGEASVVLELTRSALADLEKENPRAASAVLHTLTKTLVDRMHLAAERLSALRGESTTPHHQSLKDVLRHLFGARG